MKKSIAILSVVLLLTFKNCQNENQKDIMETTVSLITNRVVAKSSISIVNHLQIVEEQDPPWKDPWQWFNVIRELYELWKSENNG